jgi:hypothetical protein
LEGPAKLFFTQMIDEDREKGETSDLETWIERLRTRFEKTWEASLAEVEERKMTGKDTAAKYVDDVVDKAKSLDPPLHEPQLLKILRENLLPKFRKDMLLMNPKTTEDFKINLSKLMMDAAKSEGDKIDQLTAAIEKLVTKSDPPASSKQEATALVGYDQPSSSGYQNQRGSGYDDNRGRGFRGGYRGRGRGLGRGFWRPQHYRPRYNNWYGNQNFGYGYQQSFQPRHWNPGPRFMPPQQPYYQNQWQPRQPFNQQPRQQIRPGQQQAYMIEAPASVPATPAPAPHTQDADVGAFFEQFPEN